jgi:hypothetical protein
MRRAIFEWSSIVAGCLAFVFFAYWGVSIASHAADVKLKFGSKSRVPQLLITDGIVFICGEQPDDANDPYADGWTPWSLPGVVLRYSLLDGFIAWTVGVSLLFFVAFFSAVSGYSLWRYRRLTASTTPRRIKGG